MKSKKYHPSKKARNSIRNRMLRVVLPLIVIPFFVAGIIDVMIAKKATKEFTKWHLKQKELDILFLAETPVFKNYVHLMRGKTPPERPPHMAMEMGSPSGMEDSPTKRAEVRMQEFLLSFYLGRNKPLDFYRSIRFIAYNGQEAAVVEEGMLLTELKNRSGDPLFTTLSHMSPGEVYTVQTNGLTTYATPVYFDFDRDEQYSSEEFIGVISTTFTSVFREIKEIAWKTAFLATGAICLALIFTGILIAKRINLVTRPIGDLAEATRKLAEGKDPDLVTYRGHDEVGVLAQNFDEMVGNLRKRTEERDQYAVRLKELNKNLEQIVEIRTQELEQANEALKAASEHKSLFLANMSHELRTPMNAILGFTELLRDGIYGDISPKIMEIIEKIQKNGKHLLALINDVLDLTKIEAGRIEIHKARFSVTSCVDTVITNTSALAQKKGIGVVKDLQQGLMAYGDEKRINQVLWNLLSNAIKFTEQGEIHIGVSGESDSLHFHVSDTGIGIPKENIDRIFEEFTQVDASHTREYGGTGLGLAIARKLIEIHGGRIWVESEVGKGSTFHFSLPNEDSGGESPKDKKTTSTGEMEP
jgi:signal transduction histidine kinase